MEPDPSQRAQGEERGNGEKLVYRRFCVDIR